MARRTEVRPMGTLAEDIEYVRDRIVRAYRPEKIILFGSTASDRAGEDSDLDLLIIKRTRKKYFDRVLQVVRSLKTWRPVDVFVLTPKEYDKRLADNRYFLVEEILKHGKVIYEHPKGPRGRSRVA